MAEAPTRIKLKEPEILLPETKEMAEVPSTEKMEEAKGSTEGSKISEILSPSVEIRVAGIKKGPTVTPKRKRMVNVLDVLETIKSSSTTPKKTVETSKAETEILDTKAPKQQAETEAGPSEPTKVKSLETEEEKMTEPILVKKSVLLPPKHPPKSLIILFDMLRGKSCLKKKSKRPSFTPKN